MKNLPSFLPPAQSKLSANKSKVKRFINLFNDKIKKDEYTLNTGIDDDVEQLNDPEFELAEEQADKNGYILTKYDDNYNSITYKLEIK